MPSHHPEPRISCTIPSIHDDTTLDVRLYHPDILARPQSSDSTTDTLWRKKGIVMSHPYAPMGGSFDDRVVGIVVEEFLKAGWIVGTFNFRGAHGSKGRTSWSGRPELDDYISFAAFFMHYMSYIQPFPAPDAVFTPDQSSAPSRSQTRDLTAQQLEGDSPIVILGGYSYGSLILKHLPPVPSIIQPFLTPLSGSAADEILLRAHKLANQSNLEWINLAHDRSRANRNAHEKNLSVTMGGEETSPEKRRNSRELRRSMDGRRSKDVLRSLSHRRTKDSNPQTPPENMVPRPTITVPEARYLFISPLTTPISTLAAPALGPKFWNRSSHSAGDDALAKHRTLAIFGDEDVFTSAKKLREWGSRMQENGRKEFSAVEIKGAGHFWHEQGVERELRMALEQWEKRVRETGLG